MEEEDGAARERKEQSQRQRISKCGMNELKFSISGRLRREGLREKSLVVGKCPGQGTAHPGIGPGQAEEGFCGIHTNPWAR